MSGILDQAKAAATSAYETGSNLAQQAAAATSDLANQAANSETGKSVTAQAHNLGAQAQAALSGAAVKAGELSGVAHQQAHNLAPGVVPAPEAGVDKSSDLEPEKPADRQELQKLLQRRPTAEELKRQGILKGDPGDSLAGKRADLERSMLEDKLEKDIAARPTEEELVKKGILSPTDEKPPADFK
ncbi:hypothetical protein BD324DRAFT_615741 [Kockovaella imperatae]|uniref:RPEL repeat protein n=1 Tax=Kockovaella imperatae TaxID=4999 RepID=A0A1Y1US14_9TREE|nr:hypothetical protein BD324DRAFT_615741 [Kockovaella imperatae]ORX39975.1 hypothetical protein BD324DRAFT_615741 [Kockovaella imperatae]